jgi:hypothetical protein
VYAEIEAQPAERIVDMSGVAGKEDAALAKRSHGPLVDVMDVAVEHRVGGCGESVQLELAKDEGAAAR